MNISYNWLKSYLNTDLSADEIAKTLTSIGLEVGKVEKYETIKGGLKGLVVGKVLTCEKHENSDHLHVTSVDIGENEPLQIVCGAPNVAENQKVIVATIGTTLYQGEESFVIKRSKIRGVESFGMICAEDEIGVGVSHAGIMVLPENTPVGLLAREYFGVSDDEIIEVDITPNRADAASHWGVARDLNAFFFAHKINSELKRSSVENFNVDNENFKIKIRVENTAACPRYAGVTLTGVKVAQSPKWLQDRLLSIGLRPINNVVDITNFVLHAFGQPLHAFDADKILGGEIVVKNLVEGTKFTTLDGVERSLSANDLMICNAKEPMCIGGVFGGLHSGITENTTKIFLESAYFNPVTIRKTARYHGLNTDSSFRFERGINPHDTIYVLKYTAMLIKELAGGEISSQVVDNYPVKFEDFDVEVPLDKIHSLIGKNISEEEIERIFTSLEIEILSKEKTCVYKLKIPAYRVDVQRDIDVIEDILRIYGYNNVEFSDSLKSNIAYSPKPNDYQLQNLVSEQLTANGFYEIMNNSLTKVAYYENLKTFPKERNVVIINALSNDLSVMRQTLLFGGLESIAHNANRQNADLKFYEFGNAYQYNADTAVLPCNCGIDTQSPENQDRLATYSESFHLALWLTGKRAEQSWLRKAENVTVYDLKSYVQNIFIRLGIKSEFVMLEEFSDEIFVQGLKFSTKAGKLLGNLGIIDSKILKHFDINQEVYFADLQWNNLLAEFAKKKIRFEEISKFPEVKRDLALLLDKNVSFAQIEQTARKTERKFLQNITLFDVYEGKNLPENKKSYAVNFVLQDKGKTLTDKQIDEVMSRLIKNFEKELGASLR
ncbi:MAG: phenylalanine--tRNA ligase subunit beta [Prevotellaceae bacterium]|jgi:phenylalanyl-tRNA synthetase beta chain|nr:phenylalanine--tRNA ligase subunit beta [Prevotellaceae bacterium]